MAVSINAKHVALFTDAGYLWLGSANLRTKYCEIDTNSVRRPKQLVWCGTEAVVAFWEKEPKETTLLVIGRHGEMITYPYDGSVSLVPEIDGVRVLSSFQHELIQKCQKWFKKYLELIVQNLEVFFWKHPNNFRFHYSGHKSLLDRLVTRRQYYLGICIAKYLKMPDKDGSSRILVHWAKYKVSQPQLDEESVAKEIANKFGYASGISYSDIASTAAQSGRKQLAIKLLDHESKASEQVQLLLKLDEIKQALLKAIESGDTDLVYMVILRLKDNMSLGDFKMIIRNFPVAFALYLKYCREDSRRALNAMFIQENDCNSQAQGFIAESLDEEKSHTMDASLTSATKAYKQARNDIGYSVCEETLQLLKYQRSIQDKFSENLAGKSVHDTCKKLLEKKDLKEAEKMKNNFKIPDRRFWWLRIQCLANAGDWEELEKFSKSKKSPIGYAHFVDVCLQKNMHSEAIKYLPRVSEDIIVKYYVKANKLEDAAQIAYEQKDIQGLLYVQSKCASQSQLSEKINTHISQLGARK